MIALLRWTFWLCALGALVWCATTINLGDRTLWQHLHAIAGTPEARSLAAGTRDEAIKATERVRRGLGGDPPSSPSPPAGPRSTSPQPPVERLDDNDRDALDRVVQERTHHGTKAASRAPSTE